LQTFEKLRNAVNDGTADFFMWEHFTSKRYYDNGEIKKVGEIYTPWPSWEIVASTQTLTANSSSHLLEELFAKLDQGIKYFENNQEEAVKYISGELDYSEEDAREWLGTVKFAEGTKGVDGGVVEKTVGVLRKAVVIAGGGGLGVEEMIGVERGRGVDRHEKGMNENGVIKPSRSVRI
jgi:ABC-type nitrate/sulfonate/bicarbonate transport system substrate-binding protein